MGHEVTLIVPLEYTSNLKIVTYKINITKKISFYDLINFFKILFFSRKENFDIVHGHSSKGGAYLVPLLLYKNSKLFFSPHGFYTFDNRSKIKSMLFKNIEKFIIKCSDSLVLSSNHEYRHAVSVLNVHSGKIFTNPNCSYSGDKSSVSSVKQHYFNNNKINIGFCGRFCYQKNPTRFIDILLKLPQNVEYHAYLLGDGPYKQKFLKKAQKHNLLKKIIFTESTLKQFFSKIDVLIITSHYEGNAYLYQDSLMNHTPILTTNVGGSDYYVENGVNGFIFNTDSEASDTINYLYNNKQILKKLAQNCFKIQSKYLMDEMALNLINHYLIIRDGEKFK